MNLILEKLYINLFFFKQFGLVVLYNAFGDCTVQEYMSVCIENYYDHASAGKINAYYLFTYYSNQVYILMSDLLVCKFSFIVFSVMNSYLIAIIDTAFDCAETQ